MKRFVFASAVAAAVALVATAWINPAAARAGTLTLSAAKKSTAGRAAQPSGQIACTFTGCHPIPPNCTIETEFDLWGNPTGYDRVVCPRR